MLFNLSEYSPEPLHDQLRRQIVELIAAGFLRPDDRLLPISQMAGEQKVSASTVRRSYKALEKMGLIEEKRHDYFRVIKANPDNAKKRLKSLVKYREYQRGDNKTKTEAGGEYSDTVTFDRELKKAAQIQQSLFPANLPDNPFIDMCFFSAMAHPLGGDLVDIFNLDQQRLAFLIADACGHGLSAALLIARVQAIIRNESRHNSLPAVIINQLARQMEETLPRDKFITLFFAVYEPAVRSLNYINAGHPFPLLHSLRPGSKTLPGISPALGVVRRHCYKSSKKTLTEGDCLLLYTDGVSEAMNRRNEEYGEKRIKAILQRNYHDPKKLIDSLIGDLTVFTETQEAADDRSVLAVKINN